MNDIMEKVSESETAGEAVENFSARPYQVELLERAKERNTIVCLGTGTGKTFISVMLIKELAHEVRGNYKEGGRRTFFLVNTVPLASQQEKAIAYHTDLKVKHYVGEMGVDSWDRLKWENEFNTNNVLVMTAKIFRDLLFKSFILLSQVNLLIFDECHHAKKNNPYRQIMQCFSDNPPHLLPKVMGLTASIVNGKVKPNKIESEIQELECTLRSTCETSQDKDVEKYATKPEELVLVYPSHSTDKNVNILIQILSDVIKPGNDFLCGCRQVSKIDENAHCYAKFALRECKETLDELGPWAAFKVAEYLITDLDRLCKVQSSKEGRLFCEFSATQLRQLRGIYCNFTESDGSEDSGHCYFMPKLQKLLSVFREFPNSQYASEEEKTLCAIVFVERRYTALILSKQLNMAAKLDQGLSFIKSDFVIGHGTGARVNYSSKAEMNFKKQKEVLCKFRNDKKRHEFNVLIATSVVEEGLDIPKCNVVCRFNFPKNYPSYVQSKGRARAKGSRYYTLVDEKGKKEKENELEMFRKIEEILLRRCHDRSEPSAEECNESVDTDLLPPYIPVNGKGARVTMSSSVSLLSKYCSKLPGDLFTQPKPVYKVEEIGKAGYKCKLTLPINCPLREDIIGEPLPSKKQAKMAAALKACELLHKIGELDDDLLPKQTLSDEESELEEEEAAVESGGEKPKAGTKKRKRRYMRKVPEAFVSSLVQEGQPQFLTTITIKVDKLTQPQEFVISKRLFPDKTCTFGMLTTKRVPWIRSFKLYPNYGEVTVSLQCHRSPLPRVKITKQELDILREFHLFLFSHVLRSPVEFTPGSVDGYFIVMLKASGRSIDFDCMREELSRASKQSSGNQCIVVDAVVTKNYVESPQKYAVLNVRDDLTPMSSFPEKSQGNTYEEYFRLKYGEKGCIANKNQSLVEVKELSPRVNFLVDRKLGTKNRRDVICLVPELCDQTPIRASLLSVSQILPSVLQRVTSLLLVADLKIMVAGVRDTTDESSLPPIGAEEGSREAPMEVEDDALDPEEDDALFSDIRSMFHYSPPSADHPGSSLVLQAITTTHSGDAFNLERLEMLGDSFLKLAVSIHLFCTYRDKDEGKLTQRKKNQISNLVLYRAASKKSLGEYLQSTQLARDVWCPTGCQFGDILPNRTTGSPAMEVDSRDTVEAMEVDSRDTVEAMEVDGTLESGKKTKLTATEHARQKCNTQMIADKSIADSIEGLIGAYLIDCGYLGALRFMKFLGLKVLPEVDANDGNDLQAENSKSGCYARFWPDQTKITAARGKGDMVFRLTSGLENFENESISYNFQHKLYLVEALTHASYHENRVTPSYERLEFLGDALLDFLVTQHLYFRQVNLSPGELTDMRQALVNNNIFATLAVEHNYHKYLKHMSPKWFQTIKNFIDRVEDEAEERKDNQLQTVTADPFIIVSEEEEEGIEAPKVLGDIFESVAGAIFLDSGMDLSKTWDVYYRMMKPYIDEYSVNIPRNPIRTVYEEDEDADFGKAKTLDDGKIQCTLKVDWGEYNGKGPNMKIAKATAAKLAIEGLKKKYAAVYEEE